MDLSSEYKVKYDKAVHRILNHQTKVVNREMVALVANQEMVVTLEVEAEEVPVADHRPRVQEFLQWGLVQAQ